MTWGNVSPAALRRLWPFAERACSPSCHQTSAEGSGIAPLTKQTPLPGETQQMETLLYQRGLAQNRGNRAKARAFADRNLMLVKGH